MFLACASPLECNDVQEIPCGIWYLDSYFSIDMTDNLNLFSSLDQSIQTNVTLGNNIQVIVLGKGVVVNLTQIGGGESMSNVYYAKGLQIIL